MTSAAARLRSTDLLPPSALPRSLRSLRLARPPALRRDDQRLPPLIVLPLWMLLLMMLVVMASSESSRSAGAVVIVLLLVVLLYIWIRDNARTRVSMLLFYLLGIMRLFLFPAFGEILRQWYANVSAGPSLSGTHYGQNRPCGARVTMRSAAVEKPPCRRHFHLAGVIMLLDVGAAATEEQGQYGKRYAVSSRASPSAHCIHFCPQPRGEMNGQAPPSDSTTLPMRRAIT